MDVEHIYDEKIFPLMSEVIRICKENKIPFVFQAQLTDGESPLYCTTSMFDKEWGADEDHFKRVVNAMKPPKPAFAGVAVMKKENGEFEAVVTNSEGYSPAQLELIKADLVAKAKASEAQGGK